MTLDNNRWKIRLIERRDDAVWMWLHYSDDRDLVRVVVSPEIAIEKAQELLEAAEEER